MNIRIVIAAFVATSCLSACTTANPSLESLLRSHTEARGGAKAFEAVENLRTEVEIVEPTFTVRGDYRARDGAMRIDIYAEGARVFSEGVDGDGPWQQNGEGAPVTVTSAEGRAALLHGIEFNLFGLHQLRSRGHSLSLAGKEVIDGTSYEIVKVVLNDGFETYLYINPETSMIERRRDVRALHPDADPTKKLIENQYFDFTPYCGVMTPSSSRQTDASKGEELQRTKVISQECNLSDEALEIGRPGANG